MFTRCMYRWAAAEDVALLDKNPVANFRMPKAPQNNKDITIITRPELDLIFANLDSHWALFVDFMLQTGMRTGEVRALCWNDIEGNKVLVHKNWTLTHGIKNSTKTNKQRWVPLNARALVILDCLSHDDDYLFTGNRSTFQKHFRARVDKLFESGAIKGRYRPYDLRHVAISRWLEAGIPVTQAASWAGNTAEVIWSHYANTTQRYDMPIL